MTNINVINTSTRFKDAIGVVREVKHRVTPEMAARNNWTEVTVVWRNYRGVEVDAVKLS